jgi:hypothetical protein
MIERYSRLDFLKLPKIDFYQLKVEYNTIKVEEKTDPINKIKNINPKDNFNQAVVVKRGLNPKEEKTKDFVTIVKGEPANFNRWLFEIAKGSFNTISINDLMNFKSELKKIFEKITFVENNKRFFNNLYNHYKIQSQIRLAFHCKRSFETKSEVIPNTAQMLIVEKLSQIPYNDLLYPNKEETRRIRSMDEKNIEPIEPSEEELRKSYEVMKQELEKQGFSAFAINYTLEDHIKKNSLTPAIRAKNRTFHYLPYNFWQSKFELEFLKKALSLKEVKERNLEIYYNGEKDLTDFRILCFAKKGNNYQRIGLYTPDFLIIKRNDKNEIHKVLIVETKGSGYAEQTTFKLRKEFIETEFLKMNNEKFGYKKFEYLFLQDDVELDTNLAKLNDTIVEFFKD